MSDNEKINKWKSLCRNIFSALEPSNSYPPVIDDDKIAEDIEDGDISDWYDEIPDMIETPLQNAEYEATTDAPFDFDPIEHLYKENANSDIMGSFGAKQAIRTHYADCVSDITEYADYSCLRTERRQETVKVEDHRVNIIVEISSADGNNYHIKIIFTLEE